MHTMWKGSLSFGLVNVPIRMFAATESKDVSFRYLHKTCQTPIQYTRMCPTCDKAVPWDEIVKGYEYEPNQYVIFSDDEMKALKKSRAQTIDIVEFVELDEIDPIYFDKTYYLGPEGQGKKAYQLLDAAMRESHRIAIAKTVIRTNETLACIRPGKGCLVLETLFWPDEVRPVNEVPNVDFGEARPDTKELDMAVTLINQLATRFDPTKFEDEQRAETERAIRAKIDQHEVTTAAEPAKPASNIVDLMAALQESIAMNQTADKPAEKPKKARTPRKKTEKKTS